MACLDRSEQSMMSDGQELVAALRETVAQLDISLPPQDCTAGHVMESDVPAGVLRCNRGVTTRHCGSQAQAACAPLSLMSAALRPAPVRCCAALRFLVSWDRLQGAVSPDVVEILLMVKLLHSTFHHMTPQLWLSSTA